jgi:glycosyltransferase involved in cell wall biosynthesis
MTTVHVVIPDGVDDPARPSGGNTYDRHVCRGLSALGWSVHEHAIPGFWCQPDATSFDALAASLNGIPDGAALLIDGLVASPAPEVLVPQTRRLRLVVLMHMPVGCRRAAHECDDSAGREQSVLAAASAVVTTSEWTRRRLLERYSLPADRLHVAQPGVDVADLAIGTAAGDSLLCVAAVTFGKGHDVLLDALAAIADVSWHCICIGRLDREPPFPESLRRLSVKRGLDDRVQFPGPRTGADLDRSYAAADLLVLASRAETYGMVVSEALARGVPVLATDVGGLTEALGHASDGTRPGLLVPPDDPAALGAALRAWLRDAELRSRLRRAARDRRESLPEWSTTASVIASVLAGASR